jgi:cytochrome c peroxidase
MDPVMRRGRTLFSSSNGEKYPGLTQSRLGACESCHPRGGADGSMWATMEGERRTMSLRGGVAGRGWLHASATHIDAAEFVHTVVTERFGGSLGPEDEQALALYLAKGIATLQSPPVDEALAAEGKAIFATHCAGCHGGEKLTSGAPDPQSPLGGGLEAGPWLYDVGSATDDALVNLGPLFTQFFPEPERTLTEMVRGDRDLGPGDPLQAALDFRQRPPRPRGSLKAPSLVNVWDQVLFLHDGRESDLAGAVRFIAQSQGLELSDGEVAAVVEYLRTL